MPGLPRPGGRTVTSLGWSQVLTWRLRRHLLEPRGSLGVEAIVERLCGVQAQVPSTAELAIRVRGQGIREGDVRAALADGRLIRTWAMRGAIHLLEPSHGAAFLALIADARPWERPSWQRVFGMTPRQLSVLRDVVAEALAGRALSRDELIAAVAARRGLGHLVDGLRSGWGTLLKPLAWQGELCHGPSQGNRATFMRPADVSPTWDGLPTMDVAPRLAVTAYLGTHGPASPARFGRWLAGGFFGTRRLRGWFEALADVLARVDVDGEEAWVLRDDLPDLAAAVPDRTLRLLPGFDQWVLAPGTDDAHIVPAARRGLVSRQAGWISPFVTVGGVVSATWELDGDTARVAWFPEAGRIPSGALEAEVAYWSGLLGQPLRLAVVSVSP